MQKILKSGMTIGLSMMSVLIPDVKELIISIVEKLFDLDTVEINPIYCSGLVFLLFIICLITYIKYNDRDRIINIVGFGNNEYWERNNKNVETIDVRNWFNVKDKDKNKYLKKVLNDSDNCVYKYLASGLSYTAIAPIPLVSIIGRHFSKIKINNYYEYLNKSSNVKKLNNSIFFPRLKLEITNKDSSNEYALISVSTTANIKKHQIAQFGDCLHYNNYISNPHQNSIYSKKQLFNYCNKIIEQINEISALKEIKRIYIVFATQSPLPFEIGKQLNDRMAKEVIICHYQNDSCVPYEWGIALNGKNKEKYIDLKEV